MNNLEAYSWDIHDDSIVCDFCDNIFKNQRDLVRHKIEEHQQKGETKRTNCIQCMYRKEFLERKKEHSDRVSVCWKFTCGECEYGIERCWFNHSSYDKFVAYQTILFTVCSHAIYNAVHNDTPRVTITVLVVHCINTNYVPHAQHKSENK